MAIVMKKSKAGAGTPKPPAAPKRAKVISEVDMLIARLKKFRQGQRGELDLRQAIEDGRD